MRTLTATAVLSLVVHGAALAWVIATPKPEPVPVVAATPRQEDEVLTVVELLPDEPGTSAAARGVPTTVVPTTTPERVRTAVSGAPAVAATVTLPSTEIAPPSKPPEPPPTTAPPRRVFGMRNGPEVPTTAEAMAALAANLPPASVTELPDYPGLRDGVALENARARYRQGDMSALPEVVAAEDAVAAQELKPQKDGTWKTERETFVAKVERDGTVHIKDKRNLQITSPLSARFDVTDWAMRAQGIDPYASAKREYLDRTRDQRVEIGRAYRKEQLAQSDQLMNANLVRLWASTQDVAARKQGLLELWDDCAETGDAELVAGGKAARALVERWMAVKLSRAERFTADELARFNAHRRSRATLDPYR